METTTTMPAHTRTLTPFLDDDDDDKEEANY